jgi:hypothetical protein
MKARHPGGESEAAGEPRWEGEDRAFEADGVTWKVRPSGSGAYGTGDLGTARILAVHFYRGDDPDPVREALVPAARLPHFHDDELVALLESATPIEVDRN